VLEKVGYNAYKMGISPYMCIHSVVSVENLKLYESSMLDQEKEYVILSIEDLSPDLQEELAKDTIL
jgi:hypothetical protein